MLQYSKEHDCTKILSAKSPIYDDEPRFPIPMMYEHSRRISVLFMKSLEELEHNLIGKMDNSRKLLGMSI